METSKKDKLNKIASHPALVISSYILTAIGFLISLSDNIVLQIIAIVIMAICFVVLITALIRYRLNVKAEKEYLQKEFEESYYITTQNILNKASNIVRSIVDDSLNVKQNCISDNHFNSICENVCKSISSLLLDTCNIEFSVCLKQICTEELLTYNCEEASTQTIARSGSRTVERQKNDFARQKISENTSFLSILKTNDRCWASHNLSETAQMMVKTKNEYKNPDKEYANYYSSTIVVPIRIKSKYISPTILEHSSKEKPEGFHYIAFLCIDSPKTFLPDDKNFNLASIVLASCGDALYPLFENKLVKEIDKV